MLENVTKTLERNRYFFANIGDIYHKNRTKCTEANCRIINVFLGLIERP